MYHSCDHTHNGTHSLKHNAYKLKVRGVSLQYWIEQIREGFHPNQTIPSKGEVHPSTFVILRYVLVLSDYCLVKQLLVSSKFYI